MSKNAQIRLLGLIERLLIHDSGEEFFFSYCDLAKHTPLRLCPNEPEVRKMYEAEKIHTPVPLSEHHFVWMESERKFLFEKSTYKGEDAFKLGLIAAQEDKVIVVAQIVFASQFSFYVLIKRVQVHVRHQLRGQISKRNTFSRPRLEASDDLSQQRQQLRLLYRTTTESKQPLMVHAIEEFSDVALQKPDRVRAARRQTTRECSQTLDSRMDAFLSSRSVRIEYERAVKQWNKKTTNSMVQYPVPNRGFCNLPLLGVMNDEPHIRSMPVRASCQILSKLYDFVFEPLCEAQHVFLTHLSVLKFSPRGT